jgi:hypothetical protein
MSLPSKENDVSVLGLNDVMLPEIYAEILGPNPALRAGRLTIIVTPNGIDEQTFRDHFILSMRAQNPRMFSTELETFSPEVYLEVKFLESAYLEQGYIARKLRKLRQEACERNLPAIAFVKARCYMGYCNGKVSFADYSDPRIVYEADTEIFVMSYTANTAHTPIGQWEVTRGKHRWPTTIPSSVINILHIPAL